MPGKTMKHTVHRDTDHIKNRKRDRQREEEQERLETRSMREEEQERFEARNMRKERNRREIKEAAASRVSYIKKPFARRSKMSIFLAAAALGLGAAGIYGGVVTQGQAALTSAALGLCSMITAVLAVWYGAISFLEEEKNYVLARVGIVVGGILLAVWIATIVIGVRA